MFFGQIREPMDGQIDSGSDFVDPYEELDLVQCPVSERPCLPCQNEGHYNSAYGFCQDCSEDLCKLCYSTHRKARPCRDHTLFVLDSSSLTDSLGFVTLAEKHTPVRCAIHNEKIVDFFCRHHNSLFCYVCSTLTHQNCDKEYISDISEKYANGTGYKLQADRLTHILHACDDICRQMDDKTMAVTQNCSITHADIDIFKKNLLQEIDIQVSEMHGAVEKFRTQCSARCMTILDSTQTVSRAASKLKHHAETLRQSSQTNTLFICMMKAQQDMNKYETMMKEHDEVTMETRIKFVPNLKSIATVHAVGFVGTLRMPFCIPEYAKPSFVRDICVKFPRNISRCLITGMTMIDSITIAVADRSNYSVKLIDTNTDTVTHQHFLAAAPFGLACLHGSSIAVTVPTKSCIEMLSTVNLETVRVTNVQGLPYGIAYGCQRMFVTFSKPSKLE